jgi:hypothetical protein
MSYVKSSICFNTPDYSIGLLYKVGGKPPSYLLGIDKATDNSRECIFYYNKAITGWIKQQRDIWQMIIGLLFSP